jgi:hypothetical protein
VGTKKIEWNLRQDINPVVHTVTVKPRTLNLKKKIIQEKKYAIGSNGRAVCKKVHFNAGQTKIRCDEYEMLLYG